MDVHVSTRSPKRMGFYEGKKLLEIFMTWILDLHLQGLTRARFSGTKADRPISALYTHGIYRCISTVRVSVYISWSIIPGSYIHVSKATNCGYTITRKIIFAAHGSHSSVRSRGVDPRWFQRIQHPYSTGDGWTGCHWFPPDGQHVPWKCRMVRLISLSFFPSSKAIRNRKPLLRTPH